MTRADRDRKPRVPGVSTARPDPHESDGGSSAEVRAPAPGERRQRGRAGRQVAPLAVETPFVGASGGVGTSTLCRWLGPAALDAGSVPPEFVGRPYVVVTRSTAAGARAAMDLAAVLLDRPVSLRVVVAAVGDGWPEPIAARARFRAMRSSVAGIVRIPYVARWRYIDDPAAEPVPSRYARSLDRLRAAVDPAIAR